MCPALDCIHCNVSCVKAERFSSCESISDAEQMLIQSVLPAPAHTISLFLLLRGGRNVVVCAKVVQSIGASMMRHPNEVSRTSKALGPRQVYRGPPVQMEMLPVGPTRQYIAGKAFALINTNTLRSVFARNRSVCVVYPASMTSETHHFTRCFSFQVSPAFLGGGGVAGHDRADDRGGAELSAQVPAVRLHPQGLSSRQRRNHARGAGD